jgi:hypothetical protein
MFGLDGIVWFEMVKVVPAGLKSKFQVQSVYIYTSRDLTEHPADTDNGALLGPGKSNQGRILVGLLAVLGLLCCLQMHLQVGKFM